jgi:hypothetical protein
MVFAYFYFFILLIIKLFTSLFNGFSTCIVKFYLVGYLLSFIKLFSEFSSVIY